MAQGIGNTTLMAGIVALVVFGTPDDAAETSKSGGLHVDTRDKYCLRERDSQGIPSPLVRVIDRKTNQTVLNADFSAAGASVPVMPTTAAGGNLPDRRAVVEEHDNLAVDYRMGPREIYTCVSQRLDLQGR